MRQSSKIAFKQTNYNKTKFYLKTKQIEFSRYLEKHNNIL